MTTSRERIGGMLRGEKVDRVGSYDGPWADTLAAWVEQGYPTRMAYREPGEQRWQRGDGRWVDVVEAGEYEEPVPPWEHFAYDMAAVVPWADVMPIRGYDELVEETADWDIRRNGAGAAFRYWRHKSGTPEHVDFRMTSREVWERDYRPHLEAFGPERVDLRALRRNWAEISATDVWSHMGHMFIWELMRASMGDLTMYQMLLLDPDWVDDFCRVYTDLYKAIFRYQFEQIGIPDGIWLYEDMGYKNGLFASPRTLSERIFPYYTEMVDFFHGYELPVILHTCGSTLQALPLIIDAGFDGIHPMERKAVGNDPFAFAEQYGDKLIFVGGLDVRVFETNDRDIIRREVSSYIEGMKARGARLVFASDHSLSTNIHYDSYCYALDVYREHMLY